MLVLIARIITLVSRKFNLGSGSTWPGHIALYIYPRIITFYTLQLKEGVFVIAGTNGKTTTSKMVTTILRQANIKVIHNQHGANLLNGVVSSLLNASSLMGKIDADYAVFEIDEASLPLLLKQVSPKIIVLLNLFRDQLDRYGEVEIIANKWLGAIKALPSSSQLILNADDPLVAGIGRDFSGEVGYFGISDPSYYLSSMQHAVDSIFCPVCGHRLVYHSVIFSHLGDWECPDCGNKRPEISAPDWETPPLEGVYNLYNLYAAVSVGRLLKLSDTLIYKNLLDFKPAFGRQEEIKFNGKTLKIFLSKNPTGFNESLRTVFHKKCPKAVMLVLNDRIPDGRDISWIWDVDFEEYLGNETEFLVTGDRSADLTVRLKYAGIKSHKLHVYPLLKDALTSGMISNGDNEIIYILANYSAMLEVRKLTVGKRLIV